MVQGNPYLARGEAKVILNEVNSSKPSVMKGYVEVAGKKAEVIIANPSGLHCDGCGIINADRATLTTGKPQINQGNLEGFVVEKGKVTVAGKGLDNSRVDYTDILAREAKINAGVWSKKRLKSLPAKTPSSGQIRTTICKLFIQINRLQGKKSPQLRLMWVSWAECMPAKST